MEPSHVLRAMRVPFTAAHGAIRFSFSRDNVEADVDRVLAVLPGIVERARAVSLFGRRSDEAPVTPLAAFHAPLPTPPVIHAQY
jgi:cysteine desulfurase